MCIMMTPNTEPTDTLLVVAPLQRLDGEVQPWQLTYVNTIRDAAAGVLMVVPVPNKHGMGEADFVLSAVEHKDVEDMRYGLGQIFEKYEPKPATFGSRNTSDLNSSTQSAFGMLQVQEVGDYQITVAPTLADLETRAPWSRFPAALPRVGAILAGMRRDYPVGYGFVIAQAVQPVPSNPVQNSYTGTSANGGPSWIKNGVSNRWNGGPSWNGVGPFPTSSTTAISSSPPSAFAGFGAAASPVGAGGSGPRHGRMKLESSGFSIVYRDAAPFFPTAHETIGEDAAGLVAMDVTIIGVNVVLDPTAVWRTAGNPPAAGRDDHTQVSYRTESVGLTHLEPLGRRRWHSVDDLMRALPNFGAGDLHRHKILRHEVPRMVCQWKLDSRRVGGCRNTNVHGRPGTAADVATLRDTLEQLDSWLMLRTRGRAFGGTGPEGWGKLVDFVLALVGRQLGMPGVVDRIADYRPPCMTHPFAAGFGAPAGAGAAEIFYNLDMPLGLAPPDVLAGFDLDVTGFAVKDSAALAEHVRAGGAQWAQQAWNGSVFLRLAGTPCPSHLLPIAARTVNTAPPTGAPAAALVPNPFQVPPAGSPLQAPPVFGGLFPVGGSGFA